MSDQAKLAAFDNLDEIMLLMRARFCDGVSMDGRYPCWAVWLPETGRTERKTLKEAVLECAEQLARVKA